MIAETRGGSSQAPAGDPGVRNGDLPRMYLRTRYRIGQMAMIDHVEAQQDHLGLRHQAGPRAGGIGASNPSSS